MAKEDDLSENNELLSSNSSDLNNSIVNKVKSLIPTTLSKWFGKSPSVSRRRDSDSDDESFILEQPPTKRVKLPDNELNESIVRSSNTLNGSLNKYQPQNTDLQLNNIRPRQSFRQTTYYTKPEVSSQINFSRDKSSSDDDIAIPGPSGLQANQLVNNTTDRIFLTPSKTSEKLNGEKKTDSGGSTSGCSSMAHKHTQTLADKPPLITPPSENEVNTDNCSISSKRTQSSNKFIEKNITNNLTLGNLSTSTRSLFSDRSYSPRLNSSLSSRRPSFNSSSFGSSSLIDNTLSTERISNSPFYAGRTMFGGAAAYRRQKDSSTPPARNSPIQIKPTNESVMKNNNSASMSQTARRILDALEHFNTPIGDARKIPRLNISSKKLHKKGEERKRTPYSRDETPKPRMPTKELIIPTIADILQIPGRDKFVIRKQDNRNILQSHNNNNTPLPPPISLPITTLPKFELMAQPPPPSVGSTNSHCTRQKNDDEMKISKPITTTNNTISKKPTDSHTFKFAPPKAIDTQTTIDTCAKTLRSINNFKFSQPTNVKETTVDSSVNFKYPSTESYVLKTRKPINDNYLKDTKTKQDDKSLDKFKPSSNTWECDSCMIRNQLDATKCIACGVQRVQTNKTSKIENKTSADSKWECKTCLVRNNNADERCVACTALKPGVNQVQTTQSTGFGLKFKASTDTWECKTCLVRNKNDQDKCVACTTQKPSETAKNTFGTAFAKKINEWECPSCMVRNPDGKLTCACCEAPKPGQKTTQIKSSVVLPTSTPFKFGIDQADVKTTTTSSSTPSTGFVFGNTEKKDIGLKKSDEWECSACMVRNANDKLSCVCCETPKSGGLPSQKGGITLPTSTPFKFGIDKVDSADTSTATPGFTFGLQSTTPLTTSTESKPEFSFGIKSNTKTSDSDDKQTTPIKSNEFGLFKANSSVTCSSATTMTVNFAKNSMVTFGSTHTTSNTENVSSSGATTVTTTSFGNNVVPAFGTSTNASFGNISKPTTTFGNVPNATTNTPTFGLNVTTSSTTPSTNFGNNVTPSTTTVNSNPTSTTLTFGTTNVASPTFGTMTTVTSPTFGNTKTVTSSAFGITTTTATITFGNTPSATSSTFGNNSIATSSAFGNPTGTSLTFGNTTTATTLAFGNTTTTSSAFGSTTTATPSAFSSTSAAPSAFGNATTATSTGFGNTTTTTSTGFGITATTPSTGFGNTTTATSLTFGNTSTVTSPAFGNASATPTFGSTATTTIPSFGNNSLPSSSTFTFGEKLAENKPAAAPFTFGSTESSATAAKVPAFSFNSSNTPNFGTGFNTNDTSAKSNVPTFGSNLSNTNNTFGVASNQSSVQNIPTNPSFGAAAPVFGSTNATSTPAFQFGATANQPQAPPLFSFGTSNQAQTSQFGKSATSNSFGGGFGSSQQTPAPAPSIPTFNPNTKPIFNFTSGSAAPNFTAQPPSGTSSLQQPGANPQRRIKKAVRRRGGVP